MENPIDEQQMVSNSLDFKEGLIGNIDPLRLDIEDDELIKIIDQRVKTSEKYFESKYNLKERRTKNEKFLFCRQVDDLEKDGKLKDYETRSSDNALYEIEASLKPLAMSKLPDMIVTAGVEGDQERDKTADDLSIAINDLNKQREIRQTLGIAFKHLPIYFTAVIKARWNAQKQDFEFINVPPEYIIADHTATGRNADDMSFIAQVVPSTVQELFMRFPSKKDKLTDELKKSGVKLSDSPTWKELASEVNYYEVWFDWFRKKTGEMLTSEEMTTLDPEAKWEKVTALVCKYREVILYKELDPNYDWEGEEKMFSYQTPGDESTKQEVDEQTLMMSAMMGVEIPNLTQEKIYHNYFKHSKKPYYFMGYDQWGKTYLDETSRVEQNIRNQENLDDQNKSIVDQLKQRIKHIWSKDSGMGAGDVQKLDLDDPKMDALVEGDPNKVHAAIQPERPDNAQYVGLRDTRDRMYAMAGAAAVRGQIQSDTATTNQIAREADFTRADDLVEDTINAASEWIAEWMMHFIKLRYTEDHMRQIMGTSGGVTYLKLRRDMISDGMEVKIKTSSTDKLKAQRNAMETAGLGPPFTNPIDFFKDMDMDDPEGRTERGLMFMADPSGYFVKYAMHLEGTQEMTQALNAPMGAVPPGPGNSPPAPPMGASPIDTTQVAATPPQ